MTRVLTVIVNYRTAGMVADCLDTLAVLPEVTGGGMRAVVVDNASGDCSAERLEKHVRDRGYSWCSVLPLSTNGGFAAGNNAAIRPTLKGADAPDVFWLLNPDTLVRPGALTALLNGLTADPKAGIVGSRLENPDGSPQRSAFRFPGAWSEFERAARSGPVSRLLSRYLVAPPIPESPTRADWLSGASMVVRRDVFETAGLMDDKYFLYFEETDFCLRAKRAGWHCRYEPSSRVVHLVGQSTGVDGRAARPKPVPRYWFESRRRYFERSHGTYYARLADLGWLAGHALWRVRRRLERRPDDDPPGLVGDFLRHSCRPAWGSA